MAKRPKLAQRTTPRATFGYCYVNKPDDYKNQLKYKLDFTCDTAAASALMAEMDELAAERLEQAKEELAARIAKLKAAGEHAKAKKIDPNPKLADNYEVVLDADEEPTGKVKFKASIKATGENDKGETWDNKPALFDAKGKPCNVKVYGGTVGKVTVQLVPYAMESDGVTKVGVSLRLKAVQVIKLSAGGSKTAEGFGFGVEEDGFDASDYEDDEGDDAPSTSGRDEDDGDDSSTGSESDDF